MPRYLVKIVMIGLLSVLGNLACAEVVVVVSNDSPVQDLTSLQLTDIYLGRLTHLPDGQSIRPIDQSERTSTHREFYQQYLGRTLTQMRAHWSRLIFTGRGQPPKTVNNNADMTEVLNRNPNAIGYIDSEALTDGLRVLDIES